MAVDIRCKNCGDNLGKCTENGTTVHCGTCNTTQKNRQLKEYYPRIWKEVREEELNNNKNIIK